MGLIALAALVWTCLLLTIGYFVLLTLHKAEKGVKTFGKVVVAVILVSALVTAATSAYIAVTGKCPMMKEMQQMCPMTGK